MLNRIQPQNNENGFRLDENVRSEPVRAVCMAKIIIRYVEGYQIESVIGDWPSLRSDGIDEIAFGVDRFTHMSGNSVYWSYPEGGYFVVGGGPLGYGDLSPEVIVDGETQTTRQIDYAPDLEHGMVKLGWWWVDA